METGEIVALTLAHVYRLSQLMHKIQQDHIEMVVIDNYTSHEITPNAAKP